MMAGSSQLRIVASMAFAWDEQWIYARNLACHVKARFQMTAIYQESAILAQDCVHHRCLSATEAAMMVTPQLLMTLVSTVFALAMLLLHGENKSFRLWAAADALIVRVDKCQASRVISKQRRSVRMLAEPIDSVSLSHFRHQFARYMALSELSHLPQMLTIGSLMGVVCLPQSLLRLPRR